ncbi:hypothetical protein KKF38_04335, partial [Patescibacteria group bacterium]|nr:hypothetical protein [Patescibacteria group bacterium]
CVFIIAALAVLDFDFSLAADKFSHLKISLLLFVLIAAIRLTFRTHLSEAVALVLSLRDVFVIGILKELIDGAGFGNPEISDLLVNLIGIAIPFVGLFLAEFLGIGYETFVHDFTKKIHPSLQQILKNEKNYFRRQLDFLCHAGTKLIYQI